MPIKSVKFSNGSRDDVLEFIKTEKKKNKNFKVIDIGGGVYSWCSKYIDALVDLNINEKQNFIVFKGDINEKFVWKDIKNYVDINDKFDFCICTHTLEDIRNPLFVCNQMKNIAKAGYIAIPSKYIELSRFEFGPKCHRGYIHHRWIFDFKDDKFIGYPKLTVIEYMSDLDKVASQDVDIRDLNFYWYDNFELFLCNDDYMGPNAESVVKYFYNLI